jgi:flagellar protein FliL
MAEPAETKAARKSKPILQTALLSIVALFLAGDLALRGIAFFKAPQAEAPPVQGERADAGKKAASPEKTTIKTAVALEPFLVNLADKDSVRFVKASFQLGFAEAKAAEEVPNNKAVLAATRDSIISLLSSLTSEDVLSNEGKAKLREEIKRRVNALSPEFEVKDVYIVEFVVQM